MIFTFDLFVPKLIKIRKSWTGKLLNKNNLLYQYAYKISEVIVILEWSIRIQ